MTTTHVFSRALVLVFAFQIGNAEAAPTQEQKCEGRKHAAAGQYAACRQAAQKGLVLSGNQVRFGRKLGRCEAAFSKAWDVAEAKAALAGATCPDEPLSLQSVEGAVAQLNGNLASALSGGSLLSCTVSSRVLQTAAIGCLPLNTFSGGLTPCPGVPLGQDGELNKGVPHSYTDNGDGTITDNQTGLMWESYSYDGSIHDQTNSYNWYDAFAVKIAALNTSSFAGHSDWRLANINELETLRESHVYGMNFIFVNTCSMGCSLPTCSCPSYYGVEWSSTSDPSTPSYAWYLDVGNGYSYGNQKSILGLARGVRGGGGPAQPLRTGATRCDQGTGALGACPGSPAGQDAALGLGAPRSYTDNLDGTITDDSTGLMWESLSADGSVHDVNTTYLWDDAFNKIAALNSASFAGHNDWHLPNVNELRSLIQFRYGPGFDPVFNAGCTPGCTQLTCNCAGNFFWTSTAQGQSNAGQPDVWSVYANGVYPYYTIFQFSVRAVRDAF